MSARRELDDDQLAHDIEKAGYLLKKTSKGLWVNRYFVTERNTLSYWHDLNSFEQRDKASEKYELADIKSVERTSNRGLIVTFVNSSKFKLEVRALVDNERNEWASILEGKSRLYSVDELLSDLRLQAIAFQTKTFATLMYLHEKDQNKWILDRLDEVFEVSEDESKSGMLRNNSSRLLRAACRALDEYVQVCEDGVKEMQSREPKVVAHTRNYIKRYADILKGRLILELLYLPGMEQRSFEDMGEKALCSALELTHRFDELLKYPFVPRDLIATMNKTLFSTGDVLAALIKLSVKRVDALFDEITRMPTMQRSKRLSDVCSMLAEINSLIRDDFDEPSLFQRALQQMVQTQILAFSDHYAELDLSEYEETSLMDHIRACDKVSESLHCVAFDLAKRTFIKDYVSVNRANNNEEIHPGNTQYYFVPLPVLDALKCTCEDSARRAFLRAVHVLQDAKRYLLENMLHELAEGWLGGVLIHALVNTLSTWVDTVKTIMPRKFVRVIYVETSRVLLSMYIQHMISLFQKNKGISLSGPGIEQLRKDFKVMNSWINEHCLPTECLAEKELCVTMFNGFAICTENDTLLIFAQAVRVFGARHELALYDLLRLSLKYRSDFPPKARKNALALCHEFLTQLHVATQTDPRLLDGYFGRASILDDLFPLAGTEHCTGTKWKFEKCADPAAVRLSVTLMVTETINDALESRRVNNVNDALKEKIESEKKNPQSASTITTANEALTATSASTSPTIISEHDHTKPLLPPPPPVARRPSLAPNFKPPPPSTPPPARRATVTVPSPSHSNANCSNTQPSHTGIACPQDEQPAVPSSSSIASHSQPDSDAHRDSAANTSIVGVCSDVDDVPSTLIRPDRSSVVRKPLPIPRELPSKTSHRGRSDSEVSAVSTDSAATTTSRAPPPKPPRRASVSSAAAPVELSEQDAIALLLRSAQQKLQCTDDT